MKKNINITLKNNQVISVENDLSIYEIAGKISTSLKKSALFALLDNNVVDLHTQVTNDATLEIITSSSDKNYFGIINHSCAHLLAYAIMELFPETKFWVGPNIKEGFYYDFDSSIPITNEDLPKIEQMMQKLLKTGFKISKEIVSKTGAKKIFHNNKYKLALIDKIDSEISLYHFGKFVDLCRGPHVFFAKELSNFKLLSVSGAYFEGNEKEKMLTRIYGTCWASKEELDKYLTILQLRKERDHRKIGKDLKIFMFDQLVGQGLPIWLPNGAVVKNEIAKYIREEEENYGFEFLQTPIMGSIELYKTSGHAEHYLGNMYPIMKVDNEQLVLRPMSCPHHCIVYRSEIHSYRELPIRYAEEVLQHRYEASGALTGLERVRAMSLTDSHIFCNFATLEKEFLNLIAFITKILATLKINVKEFRLSLRDPKDHKGFFNDDNMWDNAEQTLAKILKKAKIDYVEAIGDAAFYGPKLDIQVETILGHQITLATLQLDFLLPKRFELFYINERGEKEVPIMIHRGLVGTYERLVSILLEQTNGNLPIWMAPKQVAIIPVHESHIDYCTQIIQEFKKNKIRFLFQDNDERLSYKIRESQTQKIPYQIIIGDKEKETQTVQARKYGSKDSISYSLNEFIELIKLEIANKN
ncbi:MAG: threonine--tRNA ligase [Mycoplasma sp.]